MQQEEEKKRRLEAEATARNANRIAAHKRIEQSILADFALNPEPESIDVDDIVITKKKIVPVVPNTIVEDKPITAKAERVMSTHMDAVSSLMFNEKRTQADAAGVILKKIEHKQIQKKALKLERAEKQKGSRFKEKVLTQEPEFAAPSVKEDLAKARADKLKAIQNSERRQAINARKQEDKEAAKQIRKQHQAAKDARQARRNERRQASQFQTESKESDGVELRRQLTIEELRKQKEGRDRLFMNIAAAVQRAIPVNIDFDKVSAHVEVFRMLVEADEVLLKNRTDFHDFLVACFIDCIGDIDTLPSLLSFDHVNGDRILQYNRPEGKKYILRIRAFDAVFHRPAEEETKSYDPDVDSTMNPLNSGERKQEEETKEKPDDFLSMKGLFEEFRNSIKAQNAVFLTCIDAIDGFHAEYGSTIDMVISWIATCYLLSKARNRTQKFAVLYLALGRYDNCHFIAKAVGAGFLTALSPRIIDDPKADVKALDSFRTESLASSTAWLSESINSIDVFYNSLWESSFVTSAKKLLLVMSVRDLLPGGYTEFLKGYVGDEAKLTGHALVQTCLSCVNTLMKGVSMIAEGATLQEVLFGNFDIKKQLDNARVLMNYKERTYDGQPIEGYMERGYWLKQAKECIAVLERAERNVSKRKGIHALISTALRDIVKEARTLQSLLDSSKRVAPVVFVVHGNPSVGKTQVLNFLYRAIASNLGIEYYDGMVHHRNVGVKHWDNHDPNIERIIHFSEQGALSKEAMLASENHFLPMFLSLADSEPYPLEMANIDGKGKVYARPVAIVIDTNFADLGFTDILRSSGAVIRRCDFIEVTNVEGFTISGTCAIDAEKAFKCKNIMEPYHFHHYYFDAINVKQITEARTLCKGNATALYDSVSKRIVSKTLAAQSLGERWKKFNINDYRQMETSDEITDLHKTTDIETLKAMFPDIDDEEVLKQALTDCAQKIRDAKDPGAVRYDYPVTREGRKKLIEHRLAWCGKTFVVESGEIQVPFTQVVKQYGALAADAILYHLANSARQYFSTGKNEDYKKEWWCVFYPFYLLNVIFAFYLFPRFWFVWIPIFVVMIVNWKKLFKTYLQERLVTAVDESLATAVTHFERTLDTKTEEPLALEWAMVDSRHYRKAMFVAGGVAVLIGLYAVAPKISKFFGVKVRTESSEAQSVPVPENIQEVEEISGAVEPRIRFKKPKVANTVWSDTVTLIRPVYTGNCQSLHEHLRNNVRKIKIHRSDGKFYNTHLLGLKGTYCLINTHALCKNNNKENFELSFVMYGDFEDANAKFLTAHVTDVVHLGNDITLVNLPRVARIQFRDISVHIASKPIVSAKGCIGGDEVMLRHVDEFCVKDNNGTPIVYTHAYRYNWGNHNVGSCGTPLLAQIGTRACIVGFHAAGSASTDDSVAAGFDLDMINIGLKNLKNILIPLTSIPSDDGPYDKVEGKTFLPPPVFQTEVGSQDPHSPHPKSVFSWFGYGKESDDLGEITYLGSFEEFPSIQKSSKVESTGLDQIRPLIEETFDVKLDEHYGPPIMEGKMYKTSTLKGYSGDETEIYLNPRMKAMEKLALTTPAVDSLVLENIVVSETKRIISELEDLGLEHLAPMRAVDVINGSEFDPYLRKVNASTSSGHGFKGIKAPYLPIQDDGKRDIIPEVKKMVFENIKRYMNNESNFMVFKASLKDEPRLISKIATGKTRMFFASSLVDLIISKMYLDPWYSLYMEHPQVFKCAAGVDMHKEAHLLYDNLLEMDEEIIEWDYSNFDQTIPFEIKRAAFSINHAVMKYFGYNSVALKVVRGLMTDMLYPFVSMDGDVYIRAGLQPSGSQATMQVNCDCNRVSIMYIWAKHPPLERYPIWNNLRGATFGDDTQKAVAKTLRDVFNAVVAKELFKTHLGMEITPASKNGDMTPTVHISETTFLKRTYKYHEKLGRIVGVLNLNSIVRSFEWNIRSDSVSYEEQMLGATVSAMYELYIACLGDDNKFLRLRESIIDILVSANLGARELFESKLPSVGKLYSSLLLDWSDGDASFGTDTPINRMDDPDDIEWVPEARVSCFPALQMENQIISSDVDSDRSHMEGKQQWSQEKVLSKYISNLELEIKECEVLLGTFGDMGMYSNPLKEIMKSVAYCTDYKYRSTVDEYLKVYGKHRSAVLTLKEVQCKLSKLKRMQTPPLDSIDIDFRTESGVGDTSAGTVDFDYKTENVTMIMGDAMDMQDLGRNTVPTEGTSHVTIEKFIETPIQIFNDDIQVGNNPFFQLDIFKMFLNEPSVRAKLKNISNIRGNMEITLNLTGNMFHKALLFCSFVPSSKTNAVLNGYIPNIALYRTPLVKYLSGVKGTCMMDFKANKTMKIIIPYLSAQRFIRLYNNDTNILSASSSFNDTTNLGTLYLYTATPVLASITGDSPAHLNVFANLVDVEYGIRTGTILEIATESAESERGPVFVTESAESVRGPVSGALNMAGKMAGALKQIPILKPLAGPAEQVFQGSAALAHYFGFSNPITNEPAHLQTLRPFANGANLYKLNTGLSLRGDPTGAIGAPNFLGSMEDEMTFESIAERPSLIDIILLSTSNLANIPIWQTYVHPQSTRTAVINSKTFVQPSNAGFVVQPFEYSHYRMIYTFRAAIAQSDRTKVLLALDPNIRHVGLIGVGIEINKSNVIVWDLQETPMFQVCVDWCQPKAYFRNFESADYARSMGPQFVISSDFFEKAIGVLSLAVINPVTTPNSSDIPIFVFAHAEEVMCQRPVTDYLPADRSFGTESAASTFGPEAMTCYDINPTSGISSDSDVVHFGESIPSFRAYLNRYMTYKYDTVSANAGTTRKVLRIEQEVQPIPYPFPGVAVDQDKRNLWGYLALAYVGFTGSFNWRFFFDNIPINTTTFVRTSLNGPQTIATATPNRGMSWQTSRLGAILNGTVTTMPDYNPAIEVQTPFYTDMLYALVALNPFDSSLDPVFVDRQLRNFRVQLPIYPAVTAGEVVVDFSTGDDFNFIWYVSAPPFRL